MPHRAIRSQPNNVGTPEGTHPDSRWLMNSSQVIVLLLMAHLSVMIPQTVTRTFESPVEEYAFSVGLQAYLYGYPLVITEVMREEMLMNPADKENQFFHFSQLFTSTTKMAVSANVDTLMSTAWVDFSAGPLLLHVPNMRGRYWVIQFNDFYSNSFAYVGQRTTGSAEQRYLLVGPHWTGAATAGMKVIRCPTNIVFLVGRVFVGGESDLADAAALQHEITLTPASPATRGPQTTEGILPKALHADFATGVPPPEIVAKMNATTYFTVMTKLLQLYPPPPQDEAMVAQFSRVGIDLDHGFDSATLEPETLRGLNRACKAATPFLRAVGSKIGVTVNGWWTPANVGVFGTDYLLRAYMDAYFIWPNVAEEALYPMATVDGGGRPLSGAHRYVLHFARGETPPVNAFWSVTMFNAKRALVENSIHRYAIGSRTEGLKYNRDGSLDLFIQAHAPAGHESNWLPAPDGSFVLTMRLYLPKPELLNGTYKIPPISCVDCSDSRRAR
jgi:hypothetical protein